MKTKLLTMIIKIQNKFQTINNVKLNYIFKHLVLFLKNSWPIKLDLKKIFIRLLKMNQQNIVNVVQGKYKVNNLICCVIYMN